MPKRDKTDYMLLKNSFTAPISATIRAYRKEVSALNAESASIAIRRAALIQHIEDLDKTKKAWVKTHRKDRKMCEHNCRPSRCFKIVCKKTATAVCHCSTGSFQKSPRLRTACNCRCCHCVATVKCSGRGRLYNVGLGIPAFHFIHRQ
jgi:hypothetical protein